MIRRFLTARRGQNTVEMALCLTVLMIFTLGVVDLGRMVWTHNLVSYLAREGARHGIVPSRPITGSVVISGVTVLGIKPYVVTRSTFDTFDPNDIWVGPTPFAGLEARGTCGDPNSPVVVTVRAQFEPITAPIWRWNGGPFTVEATSRMYVEQGTVNDCACAGTCT